MISSIELELSTKKNYCIQNFLHKIGFKPQIQHFCKKLSNHPLNKISIGKKRHAFTITIPINYFSLCINSKPKKNLKNNTEVEFFF